MAKTRMRNSMALKLENLQTEVSAALRPAAHQGSVVFYDEMKIRAPVETGGLRDSIYRAHVAEKSSGSRQVYQVGPNVSKAPHWHLLEFGHWLYNAFANGRFLPSKSNKKLRVKKPPSGHKAVHDLPGALDQPVFVPASPYIRPTFDAKAGAALARAKERFAEVLRERGVIK